MASDPHEDNKPEENLKHVNRVSSGDRAFDDAQERTSLRDALERSAMDVSLSMEAWHHLGTRADITRAFIALNALTGRLLMAKTGWKSKLNRFFEQPEPDRHAFMSVESALLNAQSQARNFVLRLQQLAAAHAESLGRYEPWIRELRWRHADMLPPDSIGSASQLRHGIEFLDAQQQLAHLAALQLEQARAAATAVDQVLRMTGALIANFSAARSLLETHFRDERDILLRHASGK